MQTDNKLCMYLWLPHRPLSVFADLLGVAQHRSDQIGWNLEVCLSVCLSTVGISDVTVIVQTLPDEIPACLFSLHSSMSTLVCTDMYF